MKFSLAWIREFVQDGLTAEEVAGRLTSAGLPVETIDEAEGDAVLDVEIVSNRPDCMNVYGLAREVAAATGRSLCPYPGDPPPEDAGCAASTTARVSIEDADLCARYCARVVRGVRIGPSLPWMARRLESVGLRPLNNVVDATNYVLWEFGHPLHAFDLSALEGREIRVRRARRGESLVTLDGVRRALEPEMLVIADAARAVAVAGVMGGAETMVTGRTVDLLLESAHFQPASVRRTSKRLVLSTDASYRFERGADVEAVVMALNRAADLIRQAAGGTVCAGVVEVRTAPPATRRIRLRTSRASLLLGTPLEPRAAARAMDALGFLAEPRGADFEVEVPSHRQDVEREVDLIEEIGRHLGYDAVPERLPHIPGSGGVTRPGHRRERALRRALAAAGFSESFTTPFVSSELDWGLRQRLDPSEPAVEPVALANPMAADQELLRTTLLPGLMACVARNANRGLRDIKLFEIGGTFRRGEAVPPPHQHRKHPHPGPVEEPLTLALAMAGAPRPRHFAEPAREVAFHDVKGAVEAVLAEAGFESSVAPLRASEALDPARAAAVVVQGRAVGRLGAVARRWLDTLDLRQDVFVAEVGLTALFALPGSRPAFRPLPRHPAVSRDLSLVVRKGQPYGELEAAIRESAPGVIARVSVLDSYAGGGLPPGTTGLTVSVMYQSPDRTLSSEEVARLQEGLLRDLERRFGVRLREIGPHAG